MLELIRSISQDELSFIAALDYGQNKEKHLEALNALIFKNSCTFTDDQYWFPYEVIQLGSHHLQEHHAREFTICTLLVIQAVKIGFDKSTNLIEKLSDRTNDYEKLPTELFAVILNAYSAS